MRSLPPVVSLIASLALSHMPLSAQTPPNSVSVSSAIRLETPTGVMAGTLELPKSPAPYPVVLIHSGSGPTDRDGNSAMLGGANNGLKMLAEGLAVRGIASVRYDKRGVGESGGAARTEEELRFDNYIDDAVAWVKLLRADKRFTTVTIAGHSEGSLIGMLAAEKAAADGMVSIAGAGRPAAKLLHDQLAPRLPPDLMRHADRVFEALAKNQIADSVPEVLAVLFRPSVQPYLISWLKHDPAAVAGRLTMPVLIVQGTTDLQVPVSEAKLLSAGQPKGTLLLIDGMNHVLKKASGDQSAQMSSYGDPSLPVAPELVEAIATFVKGLKGR